MIIIIAKVIIISVIIVGLLDVILYVLAKNKERKLKAAEKNVIPIKDNKQALSEGKRSNVACNMKND